MGIALPGGLTGSQQKEQPASVTARERSEHHVVGGGNEKSRLEPTPGLRGRRVRSQDRGLDECKAVEPKVVTRERDGKVFARGLQYTCDPIFINTFTDGAGNPLKARQFSFSVDTISWQAGDGWPVYTEYCPVNGYATGNYFRDAKTHQIVQQYVI